MTGRNVGEWSELYALSVLLTTSVDPNVNGSLPKARRVRCRRSIAEAAVEYRLAPSAIGVVRDNAEIAKLEPSHISKMAIQLLDDIRSKQGRTFVSHAGEHLAEMLRFYSASATLRDDIEVEWARSTPAQWHGVSIKSLLGAKPTLLNASPATNFLFQIGGLSIERLRKELAREEDWAEAGMKELFDLFGSLKVNLALFKMDNHMFEDNLKGFAPSLPATVAVLLVTAAFNRSKSIRDVWEKASLEGKVRSSKDRIAFVEFLGAVGLGLRPTRKWAGRTLEFGGFIVVNPDGSVVISDQPHLRALGDYLFDNLKFEWGSRDRHKFGVPYFESSKCFIKLNLQLRFK